MPQRVLHKSFKQKNLIGRRLREIRESAGVSHVQMLKLLHENGWDIDPAVLSRVEQGRRTLSDIELSTCLKALGKRWADLDEHTE